MSETADQTAQGVRGAQASLDPGAEVWPVIDASIHDLRTPLGAMSGWLEVLEARADAADSPDPMAARALVGLRRAIEQQTRLLEGYAQVADTRRRWPNATVPRPLAAVLAEALGRLDAAPAGRLTALNAALNSTNPGDSPTCRDAGDCLVDAVLVLLKLLVSALGDGHQPGLRSDSQALVIDARTVDALRVDVQRVDAQRVDGEPAALAAFCVRPDARAARIAGTGLAQLWNARNVLRRCGIGMRFAAGRCGEGFSLTLLAQAFEAGPTG